MENLLLWPDGAPGSDGRSGLGMTRLYDGRERIVSQVHEPSLVYYLPDEANRTGTGIVIFPGGGHRELWSDHEGHNVAKWFADRGIAAFVVFYRLAREEGSEYDLRTHSLADAQRAVQLVKSSSDQWHLDTERIGIIGFSAGGELAALAGSEFLEADSQSTDEVLNWSSRPAFQALIYPGSTAGVEVKENAPHAFLVSGHEDGANVANAMLEFYSAFYEAGVSAEMHIYADAGHGFGLRDRNEGPSSNWLQRMYEWMDTKGLLVQ